MHSSITFTSTRYEGLNTKQGSPLSGAALNGVLLLLEFSQYFEYFFVVRLLIDRVHIDIADDALFIDDE